MTELLLSLALAFMFVGGSHLASRRVAVGYRLQVLGDLFSCSFLCPVSHNVWGSFSAPRPMAIIISENTISSATLVGRNAWIVEIH